MPSSVLFPPCCITTEIPHSVYLAVPRNSRIPSIDYPPIQVHRYSNQAYNVGIERHVIDGASVKIYTPEKTLADCFKFRNKIGMDVVLEALKLYKSRKKLDLKKLFMFSEVVPRKENYDALSGGNDLTKRLLKQYRGVCKVKNC